ncbi:MAG: 3-hydroxyacyl-CoA dehydrogenase, partial [Burkholderiaceae bacterium]
MALQTIRYALDADGIATLTLDAPGAAVNTMTAQWQADWTAAVAAVVADKDRVRGVLLASAKPTFFAGAELKDVLTLQAS